MPADSCTPCMCTVVPGSQALSMTRFNIAP
jgi:hypothetical protein